MVERRILSEWRPITHIDVNGIETRMEERDFSEPPDPDAECICGGADPSNTTGVRSAIMCPHCDGVVGWETRRPR